MTHELYKTKEEIESWLIDYGVENYELIKDEKYGYVVNVNKFVNLSHNKLTEIKVKFNIINRNFDISSNKLKTLKGCPKIVNGFFSCYNNDLKSLEGCPEIINGLFMATKNKLKNLKGCPKEVKGNFDCSNNYLETLKYLPEKVNEDCYFDNNPELKEIQKITDFNELKKIHDSILLNKKLKQEISIDNNIKNVKIKL